MNLLPTLLCALGLQTVVTVGGILLAELVFEEERARALEWLGSLAITAALLLLVLAGPTPPPMAAAATAGFSLVQFALGWGLARLGGAVADLGTQYAGLGPRFPLAASLLVIVLFVPTGLGRWIGIPDLFVELETLYAGAIVAQILVLALHHGLADRGGGQTCLWIGTLAVLAGFHSLAAQVAPGGRAAILSFLLAGLLVLLELGLAITLERVIGPAARPENDSRNRGRLLLVAWTVVLALWIGTQWGSTEVVGPTDPPRGSPRPTPARLACCARISPR